MLEKMISRMVWSPKLKAAATGGLGRLDAGAQVATHRPDVAVGVAR
jgi:hypothetical protein